MWRRKKCIYGTLLRKKILFQRSVLMGRRGYSRLLLIFAVIAYNKLMNLKKLIFATPLLAVMFLLLNVQPAYAHIPSYNPYGTATRDINSDCSLGPYYNTTQLTQEGKTAIRRVCEIGVGILREAVERNDRNICKKVETELNTEFDNGKKWPVASSLISYDSDAFSFEGRSQAFTTLCYGELDRRSILVVPDFVPIFDFVIFFITSSGALIYFILLFRIRGVRGLRMWLLPILFQIMVSFASFFAGVISTLLVAGKSSDGPPIPPLHDFLFFQQAYYTDILISAVATVALTFFLAILFLLLYKNHFRASEKFKIALFYTLVANPFFFPIGPIFGLINLIHANKTSGDISPS